MDLIFEYTRFLTALGHEQNVYIPKSGTIDKLFELAEQQYDRTEKGFYSMGFTFVYFNPELL